EPICACESRRVAVMYLGNHSIISKFKALDPIRRLKLDLVENRGVELSRVFIHGDPEGGVEAFYYATFIESEKFNVFIEEYDKMNIGVGIFNCQGVVWCKVRKRNLIHDKNPGMVSGVIRAKDMDYLSKVTDENWIEASIKVEFRYDEDSGLVTIDLSVLVKELYQ
ncbi:hypothetical protein HN51_036125, partial [Arachis hypogaea]